MTKRGLEYWASSAPLLEGLPAHEVRRLDRIVRSSDDLEEVAVFETDCGCVWVSMHVKRQGIRSEVLAGLNWCNRRRRCTRQRLAGVPWPRGADAAATRTILPRT